MAKKKVSKKKSEQVQEASDGRVRMAFRFDPEVARGMNEITEKMQISVNQLVNAMCYSLVRNANPCKELIVGEDNQAIEREQDGVIWFGKKGPEKLWWIDSKRWITDQEKEYMDIEESIEHGNLVPKIDHSQDKLWFTLDFTVRRVMKED